MPPTAQLGAPIPKFDTMKLLRSGTRALCPAFRGPPRFHRHLNDWADASDRRNRWVKRVPGEWAELLAEIGGVKMLKFHPGTGKGKVFHPLFLRDVCKCPKCVDSSSTQKNFSTTDIPHNITIKSMECTASEVQIAWENDIPGFGEDHVSTIPRSLLSAYFSGDTLNASLFNSRIPRPWTKATAEKLPPCFYDSFMQDDAVLFLALLQLDEFGFVILRGLPEDEKSVEAVAGRIGTIRDTFYGRTWDVKSKPKAKNVAYTQQYLGLHMDLLYMQNPPGLQFLHCLKNTCEGGSSLLSDSFQAALSIPEEDEESLCSVRLAYHYKNDGHYYYKEHQLVQKKRGTVPLSMSNIRRVNFSPPFQAPIPISFGMHSHIEGGIQSLKKFTELVESEENLFEYRMEEGDCVIFNNRRVLHGRRAFDSSSGERWLKGCYVDMDVFESRLKVLNEAHLPSPISRVAAG